MASTASLQNRLFNNLCHFIHYQGDFKSKDSPPRRAKIISPTLTILVNEVGETSYQLFLVIVYRCKEVIEITNHFHCPCFYTEPDLCVIQLHIIIYNYSVITKVWFEMDDWYCHISSGILIPRSGFSWRKYKNMSCAKNADMTPLHAASRDHEATAFKPKTDRG